MPVDSHAVGLGGLGEVHGAHEADSLADQPPRDVPKQRLLRKAAIDLVALQVGQPKLSLPEGVLEDFFMRFLVADVLRAPAHVYRRRRRRRERDAASRAKNLNRSCIPSMGSTEAECRFGVLLHMPMR